MSAASDVFGGTALYSVEAGDCVSWMNSLQPDCVDLVLFSPPYELARLYLEGGVNLGVARPTDEWVEWMVQVFRACRRICKGLVACVCEGQTRNYSWSGAPVLLMARLIQEGFCLRKPPVYNRVGVPGSGGPDWLRNDYEFIVCTTRGGKLPWSDNTACGHDPIHPVGGAMSNRNADGVRINAEVGIYKTQTRRRLRDGKYKMPTKANPGNVIKLKVGGGLMGHPLAHENEAPFSQSLSDFFVQSFCPHGGIVCDPFIGSGTTIASAIKYGRRGIGCDLRPSQVDLAVRRIESPIL